ncbi:MAG: hypothetical protein M0T77_04910, partial [Actinomycetota bacterium]|nr:hypothetical protein [Actinomycetota bacterium]
MSPIQRLQARPGVLTISGSAGRWLGAGAGAAFAIAVATATGASSSNSIRAPLMVGVAVLALPAAWFLLTSERLGLTLGFFMVYLGCLDGVVKLESGSSLGTLGRDIVLWAICAGALIRLIARRQPVEHPPATGLVLLWVAVILVQIPNPGGVSLTHSVISVRPDLEFVPLFFIGYAFMRSQEHLDGFLVLLLILAAINGLVSLIQYNLTPQQLASWGPGYSIIEL